MSSAVEIGGLLALGLTLGMKHALEADHVAAVAALATRSRSVGHTVLQGVVWGMGHTATLFLFGGVVLAMQLVVPERLAFALELTVGVMLVILGLDVFRRMRRDRVHFHAHAHADRVVHLHAHSHGGDAAPHDAARHHHPHPERFPVRALLVGMTHGMAGSAALIVMTLGSTSSLGLGLGAIAAFGVGSIAGMAALSLVIAIPLRLSARLLTRVYDALQALAGSVTLVLGAAIVYQAVVAQ